MRGPFFKSWLKHDTFQHEQHVTTEIEGVKRNGLLISRPGWSRRDVIRSSHLWRFFGPGQNYLHESECFRGFRSIPLDKIYAEEIALKPCWNSISTQTLLCLFSSVSEYDDSFDPASVPVAHLHKRIESILCGNFFAFNRSHPRASNS